jgi:NADPH-dependent 2,4-dienoyl-CoA reductase/sulfur reductase-like enzyme
MTVADLVVVGASLAGLRAVQAARRPGHRRRITLVGAEAHLPHNRPPLSKGFLAVGTHARHEVGCGASACK